MKKHIYIAFFSFVIAFFAIPSFSNNDISDFKYTPNKKWILLDKKEYLANYNNGALPDLIYLFRKYGQHWQETPYIVISTQRLLKNKFIMNKGNLEDFVNEYAESYYNFIKNQYIEAFLKSGIDDIRVSLNKKTFNDKKDYIEFEYLIYWKGEFVNKEDLYIFSSKNNILIVNAYFGTSNSSYDFENELKDFVSSVEIDSKNRIEGFWYQRFWSGLVNKLPLILILFFISLLFGLLRFLKEKYKGNDYIEAFVILNTLFLRLLSKGISKAFSNSPERMDPVSHGETTNDGSDNHQMNSVPDSSDPPANKTADLLDDPLSDTTTDDNLSVVNLDDALSTKEIDDKLSIDTKGKSYE
jgi:hypothetical protein